MPGPVSLPPGATLSVGRASETFVDGGIHRPDDRWIPVRPETLAVAMARDAPSLGPAAVQASDVEAALARVVDQEARGFAVELDRRYARFNPDRETLIVEGRGRGQRAARFDLLERLTYLLEKANFERLDERQLEAALATANTQGMKIRVDPSKIERLELFVRGQARVRVRVKTPKNPILGEERELDVYRRLAVIFQLKGDTNISLKMFREIPVADLESLLPHAEVEMNWFDRAKIMVGGAGALGGLASKVFSAVVGGAAATGNLLWVGIAALFGVSARSFMGYRRAKLVRNSQMTHNLYFQNVANNVAVLHLLTGNIAMEEVKEALLAYVFCAALHGHGEGASEAEDATDERGAEGSGDRAATRETAVDEAVEAWLRRRFDVHVNFDCPDALETLDRFDLWANRAALEVVPPDEAIARLEAHWKARRSVNYHAEASSGGDGSAVGTRLLTVAPARAERGRRARRERRGRKGRKGRKDREAAGSIERPEPTAAGAR